MQRDNNAGKGKKPGGVTGKGFVKGDPRINRKGRPKGFDQLRALVQEVLAEPTVIVKRRERGQDLPPEEKVSLNLVRVPLLRGGKPVLDELGEPVMVEHYATNAEMIVRQMMKDRRRQVDLLEIGYGKVPQGVELTGKGGAPIQTQEVPVDMEALKRMVEEKKIELARLEMERENLDVSEGRPE